LLAVIVARASQQCSATALPVIQILMHVGTVLSITNLSDNI